MEWISVKDRVPDNTDDVLACNAKHRCFTSVVAYYNNHRNAWDIDSDILEAWNHDGGAEVRLDMDITHWMPLPEPPK